MTNQIDELMRLAAAYRMADTVDLWPTECDLKQALEDAFARCRDAALVEAAVTMHKVKQEAALEPGEPVA